jgi:hypothetical protein
MPLYKAAKIRQYLAVISRPDSSPSEIHAASRELGRIAEPLYAGFDAGPTALVQRLEREGIEAVEHPGAVAVTSKARPQVGFKYEIRFPSLPMTPALRVLGHQVAGEHGAPDVGLRRRVVRAELLQGAMPSKDGSRMVYPPANVDILEHAAEWVPVNEPRWQTHDALLNACREFVASFSDDGQFNTHTADHSIGDLIDLAKAAIKLAEGGAA